MTDIWVAARAGDLARIIELLDSGEVKINDKKDERTPLILASCKGHEECVTFLLNRGAIVDLGSDKGFTPLRAAISEKRIKIVQILLDFTSDKRAYILKRCNFGYTSLHSAAIFGFDAIFDMLLKHVFVDDLEIENNFGESVWDVTHSEKIQCLISSFRDIPQSKHCL